MKIIQSYWSHPNRINEINDPNGRHNGGWIQRESSLFCWALSVLKLRQFYDTVELVTDSDGWAELIRDINLPYTNVSTELDWLQDVHPNLWSMGKLFAYSIQKEHFIHVDGDFIIWKEFPKEICNSDAVAQNREVGYPYYYLIKDQIKDFHLLPPSLNNSPIISINAGIIGGKKIFLFDKLYQKASDFIRVNKGLFHTCNVGLLNIIVEQLLFHEICSHEKMNAPKLLNAVRVANIQEFIEELPLGYNTKIGADGTGISAGQRQRMLIARAVYRNPHYLFFDEATSALDANNEKVIMENLDEFFKGRTVVVIAHRLSTVKNADKIVVLEGGRVVEEGSHAELTATKGKYFELVKNQLELGS